ncbi:hypothetical protein AHAS_Ahas17G0261800 [Arachis hypogaea]
MFESDIGHFYTANMEIRLLRRQKKGLVLLVIALSATWTDVKIRKALNFKSVLKSTFLPKTGVKAAVEEFKVKSSK